MTSIGSVGKRNVRDVEAISNRQSHLRLRGASCRGYRRARIVLTFTYKETQRYSMSGRRTTCICNPMYRRLVSLHKQQATKHKRKILLCVVSVENGSCCTEITASLEKRRDTNKMIGVSQDGSSVYGRDTLVDSCAKQGEKPAISRNI